MATGDSEFEVLGSQVSLQRHDKSVRAFMRVLLNYNA
jgi:hypothetical protein